MKLKKVSYSNTRENKQTGSMSGTKSKKTSISVRIGSWSGYGPKKVDFLT